jgi:hypothetical protein
VWKTTVGDTEVNRGGNFGSGCHNDDAGKRITQGCLGEMFLNLGD